MKKEINIQINFWITTALPKDTNFQTIRQHVDINYEAWKKRDGHLYPNIKDTVLKRAYVYRYFDQVYAGLKTIPIETRSQAKQTFMRVMLAEIKEPITTSTSSQFPKTKVSEEEWFLAQTREWREQKEIGGIEYWKLLFE